MTKDRLWIDFETRSAVPMGPKSRHGSYKYARHLTSDITHMAWARNDEPTQLWQPGIEGVPLPVVDYIRSGHEVWAHNAIFERLIIQYIGWPRYGMPMPELHQFVCVLAMCAKMAIPLALEDAAIVLRVAVQKDMVKQKAMHKISKPLFVDPITGEPTFATRETHPQEFEDTGDYCMTDLDTMRAVANELRPLNPFERKVYIMDQTINDRGVKVDVPIVRIMLRLADKEKLRVNEECLELCGLNFTQNVKLKEWVKAQGIAATSLDKHHLGQLLARTDLPDAVRKVLLLRQEGAKSSVAKLEAMLERCEDDGRARGLFQFMGAVSTHRWSHRAIQTGNMPRPDMSPELIEDILDWLSRRGDDDPDDVLEVIRVLWGRPMKVFSDCLRGLLIPEEGKWLIGPDLVSIEPLTAAWLVGNDAKVQLMASGVDIYKIAARLVYGLPPDAEVTKRQRQDGKVLTLACGYEGGKKAINDFCVENGVPYPGDVEALRWRDVFREAHPLFRRYWKAINKAAIQAVLSPGSKVDVGPDKARTTTFLFRGKFLECMLPSGFPIFYPFPRIEEGKYGRGMTYMKLKDGKWFRNGYYGGHGLENNTQSLATGANGLLGYGLLNLEAEGHPVVMHSHDEGVVEVGPLVTEAEVMEVFNRRPAWAATLPYTSSAFRARRYRK